jgi:hypothetical protein
MTRLSRWVGLLDVLDGPFDDKAPIFYPEDDPFTVRFHVTSAVWLPLEKTIPIHVDTVWNGLSFTHKLPKGSLAWTGKVRGSLGSLSEADGAFLDSLLRSQAGDGQVYPVDADERRKLISHRVRRADKNVIVRVPDDTERETTAVNALPDDARESIKIQALLAQIGARMGMQIWIPRGDRTAVLAEWHGDHSPVLERLPLNYDDITLRTIERIDVLWLRGRSIKRAFEVEHTTSIYSGILRMADLLALQPNMDIRLHIVAPANRREKVFEEILRPVFSLLALLGRGALSERCTFVSYDSVQQLAALPHLAYLSDMVLEEYEEEAEG